MLLRLGRRCRRFESCHSDQKQEEVPWCFFLFFSLEYADSEPRKRRACADFACFAPSCCEKSPCLNAQNVVLNPVTPTILALKSNFQSPFLSFHRRKFLGLTIFSSALAIFNFCALS